MAFALTRPSWKGSTFGRLKGDRHNFPVARGRDGWSLDSILQQDWWRLENVLKLVYESTFRLVPTAMHPLDFQVYRAPATWRYMQTHQSENLARIHVYNSRNAFVLLMALCSYAIAISEVQFYGTETTQSVPRWIQALVERENAPAVWTDELIQSELSLTNVARVGVYIDWSSFEYTNLIPCFVMLGVPVWIKLPSSSSIPQGPAIQLVKPEILEKSSQHFLQETPETFFSRIEKRRERFKMLENAKTRMIRVDRERRASSYQCPEHNAATLYEWREKDEAFIRIRITSLQKPVVWANYRNSQKHYDSISDEWDLCTLLDPDVHLDDGMDDAEGIYQVGEYANRTDATADILPDVDIPQALSYLVSNLKEQTSLRSMFHPSHETLEDKLFYRYGFHPDGSIYSPPQNCLSVHRVAKTLVEDELQLEEQSNKEVVVHFVTAYASQSASVPPSLHDLSEENVFSLKERMNQAFRVVKQEQGHYSISDGDIANLNISVLEASLAVEVLRLSMGSLCSVSQRFISRGTRFRINAGCGNPFPSNSTRGLGLGFRPHGYRPDRSDYQCYIKRRNELLSDLTIARAALFYGGIVWRLTVDAIVDVHGQIDFTHLLQAYFDDIEITQNILSIIVGLYQIWSGRFATVLCRLRSAVNHKVICRKWSSHFGLVLVASVASMAR